MERLKRILDDPYVNIFIAIVLVYSSVAEGWEEFTHGLTEFDIGVHHGVLLYGVAMFLRGLVEAAESTVRAHEKRNGAP